MDEQVFGPYSAKEILELNLPDDILVTEEKDLKGVWLKAGELDFDDMAKKEARAELVNDDGTIINTQCRNNNARITSASSSNTQSSISSPSVSQPSIIGKWNWGAFYFGCFWGIFNGVYWPLWTILAAFIPIIGQIFCIGVIIYLGCEGNRLSWENHSWNSVEDFESTQKTWSTVAIWIMVIAIILSIVLLVTGLLFS